jgi:hypothetical protein
MSTISYLKIGIFVRYQGEAETQPAGILEYVEDLPRGLDTDIGEKDFFEYLRVSLSLRGGAGSDLSGCPIGIIETSSLAT